jgi:drug/metabolite transporter (DMT)-like permease
MSASSFRKVKRRNSTVTLRAEQHVSSGLAAVLQATIPIFGMFFAHVMLPDEPLQLPKLLGVLLALGGVTLICGPLLGFNSPFAFRGGVAVVVGAASAACASVLVKARSIQLAQTCSRRGRRFRSNLHRAD